MPGHTFIYSPAVNHIRDLIRDDVLGDIHFITSSRMNLGKYQSDGVVCDLAPHDLSILQYWLDQPIMEVAAAGRSVFQQGAGAEVREAVLDDDDLRLIQPSRDQKRSASASACDCRSKGSVRSSPTVVLSRRWLRS